MYLLKTALHVYTSFVYFLSIVVML